MKTVVAPHLVPKGYRAITVFPFVFVRTESDLSDAVLLRHERIHGRQQAELLLILFFIWYGIDYGIRRLSGETHHEAYQNIIFEREAYGHESEPDYLERRKPFDFLKG